jgi:peptidoglycan/LPS O-acetylase OafA/YrhL
VLVWPSASTLAVWPAPIIAEFAFGVLIGAARAAGWRLSPVVSLCLVIAGAALLFGLDFAGVISPRVIVWGVPVAAIVAGAALAPEDLRGPTWDWLAKLGDASYALYLIHPFMLIPRLAAQRLFGVTEGPWSWWPMTYAIVLLLGSVVASLLIHRYVEKPAIEYLRGSVRQRASRKAAERV